MCFPKFRCNRQTIDKATRSARLFIFCDQIMNDRVDRKINFNSQFYNAAISDDFCIGGKYGHKVGEKCEKKKSDLRDDDFDQFEKGVCTLMQTQVMMDVDIRYNYPMQRTTL